MVKIRIVIGTVKTLQNDLPEKVGKKMLGVQITSLTCVLFDVELELVIIILFEVIFDCDLTAVTRDSYYS